MINQYKRKMERFVQRFNPKKFYQERIKPALHKFFFDDHEYDVKNENKKNDGE